MVMSTPCFLKKPICWPTSAGTKEKACAPALPIRRCSALAEPAKPNSVNAIKHDSGSNRLKVFIVSPMARA